MAAQILPATVPQCASARSSATTFSTMTSSQPMISDLVEHRAANSDQSRCLTSGGQKGSLFFRSANGRCGHKAAELGCLIIGCFRSKAEEFLRRSAECESHIHKSSQLTAPSTSTQSHNCRASTCQLSFIVRCR